MACFRAAQVWVAARSDAHCLCSRAGLDRMESEAGAGAPASDADGSGGADSGSSASSGSRAPRKCGRCRQGHTKPKCPYQALGPEDAISQAAVDAGGGTGGAAGKQAAAVVDGGRRSRATRLQQLNVALAPGSKTKLQKLKQLAAECGVTPTADKRRVSAWRDALTTHAHEIRMATWAETGPGSQSADLNEISDPRMKDVEGIKRAKLKAYVEQLLHVSPLKMQAVLDAGDKRCNRTYIAAIRVAEHVSDVEHAEGAVAAAACKVQRAFRCFQARGLYYEMVGVRAAAVVLQSALRRHIARDSALRCHSARDTLPLPRELFPPDNQAHSPQDRLRVMSWNIRKFTQTDRSERLRHLKACIAKVMPTVLLIQEVQTGGGGERALDALVRLLAQLPGTEYRCTLSPRVSSDRPSEHHACVWNACVLGEAPPQWEVWRGIRKRAPLNVEDENEDIKAARRVWGQLTSDAAFDRAPAFVHFSNGTTVGSVHHARSPALKVKAEALALQALLGAAAKRGLTVILCGDFNVDEAHGGAGRASWVPGACKGDDKTQPIRSHFFDKYAPCIPYTYSTNLFPFTEHPQHNDQIWVTRSVFCTPEFVGGGTVQSGDVPQVVGGVDARPHGDGGTGQSGDRRAPQAGVSMIPTEVVEEVQRHAKERKLFTRSKVFAELSAHLFSDHRPVWADLCCKD